MQCGNESLHSDSMNKGLVQSTAKLCALYPEGNEVQWKYFHQRDGLIRFSFLNMDGCPLPTSEYLDMAMPSSVNCFSFLNQMMIFLRTVIDLSFYS